MSRKCGFKSVRETLAASLAAGLFCVAALSSALGAEEARDAIPNFSAPGVSWELDNPFSDLTNSEFLPVPGDPGPGPVRQHPDYPYDGDITRRMADTSNPILQPSVKEQMDVEVARVLEGMQARSSTGIPFIPTSRCWPGGVPGLHLYTAAVQYLQTPDQVWLLSNRGELRRVYLNVPHSDEPGFSWYGESVGHYENGDTLVIDTIGLDDKGPIDRLNTPHSRQLHVVERHRLIQDGERMRVTIHVIDPGVFTMPWNAMVEYARVSGSWHEWICAENAGDYHFSAGALVPIPSDDMPDF